ncbi:MAG: MarR family transcriptional regulator, partial [Chloroflexi bacterium]|nr:MarR family transcriptional regulator [Chloroflexota bacterium]
MLDRSKFPNIIVSLGNYYLLYAIETRVLMGANDQVELAVDKFWEAVPPAWHQARARIRRIASEKFNLTVEQFQVLRRIRRGSGSVSALAEANRTSRSSVSKVVDVLVNKGLVSRRQNPDDRRNIPLSLTADGQRIMDAIFDETESWLATQFRRLDAEELKAAIQGMEALQKS